jgi:dTDP-4-amino-4,6-dideoxygalactose transaminase
VRSVLESGRLAGPGPLGDQCEALLEDELGAGRVLLTSSCTAALDIAALLLDIGPGDEVVVPSFTFPSTANAFALRGARLRFCDIRPDTFNVDERRLAELVTERTRAVVVVHYAGVGAELADIMATSRNHGVAVVEDNAHGLFGSYRGQPLGTFGTLATLSFHETKNVSCGEGGALVINDPALVERAEVAREKGTDRRRHARGEVDRYSWVGLGSSYVQAEILAAVLLSQLERSVEIQRQRAAIWNDYSKKLSEWAAGGGVQLPCVPADCEPAYHLFSLLMPSHHAQGRLIEHLAQRDILGVFHYVPLHRSAMGAAVRAADDPCPVTESVSERLVRLPFFTDLTAADQQYVIDAVCDFDV